MTGSDRSPRPSGVRVTGVSQCLELDIASQGATEDEALENLREALELHFEPPQATRPPNVRTIDVEVGAA
jgi:hypothetical protein